MAIDSLPQDDEIISPVRASGVPRFTLLLIAGLAAAFVVEIKISHDLSPSPQTLVQLGGLMRPLVLAGDWWRIFTAPLLHADPGHLIGNSVALLIIGVRLEPLIGSRWFAGVFAISAFCGSLLSMLINPPTVVGIGASSGIVGLFAASLLVFHRLPERKAQVRLIAAAAISLAPALLPFLNAAGAHDTPIDYGAHFGGAIGGLVMGYLALCSWPRWESRPDGAVWTALLAGLFFLLAASGLTPITHATAQSGLLIPDFPTERTAILRQMPGLVQKYPHDPRARLSYAGILLTQRREPEAEKQLRAALAETDLLQQFPATVENTVRAMLALVLVDEGKPADGRAVLGSSCADASVNETIRQALATYDLCV